MPFFTSPLVATQVTVKVFQDPYPRAPVRSSRDPDNNLVYLLGQTDGNEFSVLNRGRRLAQDGFVSIGVSAFEDPKVGYSGRRWAEWLSSDGGYVSKQVHLIAPALDLFPASTDAEAHGLVRFASSNGFTSVFVVSAPFHQIRAMISTISAAIKNGSADTLNIWSVPGTFTSWSDAQKNTQSTEPKTWFEELGDEMGKIDRYRDKGDLVSAEEIFAYLDARYKRVGR